MAKKIITIASICGFCASAILLIMAIFGVSVFEGVLLDVLITFACIAVGGFFAINSLNVYSKNRLLSLVSLVLIGVSVLGILIVNYFSIDGELAGQLVFTIAMLSVLFNVIVSNVLTFGKKLIALQVAVYLVLIATIIMAILLIFGIDLGELTKVLISLLVLSVVGVIVLAIFKKKNITEISDSSNKVTITKEEYDTLIFKANEYDKLIAEKKE